MLQVRKIWEPRRTENQSHSHICSFINQFKKTTFRISSHVTNTGRGGLCFWMDNHQRNDHAADPWTVHQQCKKYFKKLVSRVDLNYRTERWKDFISCYKCLEALKVWIPSFHLQIKVYIYKIVDSNSHNLKLWIKPEEETTTDTLIYSEFVRQEQMKFCFASFVILICLSSLGELRQTASFLGAILVTARWSENKSKSWPPAATSLKSTQTCKTKWGKKRKPEFVWRVFVFTVHLPARRRRLSHLWSVPLTTPQAAPFPRKHNFHLCDWCRRKLTKQDNRVSSESLLTEKSQKLHEAKSGHHPANWCEELKGLFLQRFSGFEEEPLQEVMEIK